MRVDRPGRLRRAGVSTVIGTMIFILAAVSVFAAFAATNIAGFNYQSAVQQAAAKNSMKSQEAVQLSPTYDTAAYAEYQAMNGKANATFLMTPSATTDLVESAFAVYNSTAELTVSQRYAASCIGSSTCSIPMTYLTRPGDQIIVGVAVGTLGAPLSVQSVSDTEGNSFIAGQVAKFASASCPTGCGLTAAAYYANATAINGDTITVSLSGTPSNTFSVWVYDLSGAQDAAIASQKASGASVIQILTPQVPVNGSYFLLGFVVGPAHWRAMAGPGFTLDAVPAEPTSVTLTDSGPSAATFATVIYVYHERTGSVYTSSLGQYVENFNARTGTCASSGSLAAGAACNYLISPSVQSDLGVPFSLTDPNQKLSVGLTTSLGNTFWYNYTEFVAVSIASGASIGYPYIPNLGDMINVVVAQGLGPNKLSFQQFKYFAQGAGGAGSGFQVGGYFGFSMPQGTSLVWAVTVTNYDPQGRAITVGPQSSFLLSDLMSSKLFLYGIVGNLTASSDDQSVTYPTFTTFTIPYKASAILYFGAGPKSTSSPHDLFTLDMLLVGTYEGDIPFAQVIPVAASYATAVTYDKCYVGTGTGGAACANAFSGGDPVVKMGSTYTFTFNGFATAPEVNIITHLGDTPKSTDITASTTTSYASFTIPTGLAPGFYEIDVVSGIDMASVTVEVTS